MRLQLGGWWFGAGCLQDQALYRSVVRHGEEFLATQPNSPLRAEVAFTLALAYETWWSLVEFFHLTKRIDLAVTLFPDVVVDAHGNFSFPALNPQP